jgi:hypothetical protein
MATGLLVAIDPYIARLSSGANVGYFGPINTTTLKLTQPDPDKIERISYLRSSYGQALDSYNRPKPVEIEFTIDDCDPDLLSMAMLGTPATYTQSARLIGDAASTFTARYDKWVSLSHNSLTNFVITGKTLGTDYELDLDGGLCKVLSTGTIADASTVSYTAAATARSGDSIDAGTETVIQLAIRGVGKNLFNDRAMEINVWQANISPSGALDFISKEPISLTFKGTCIVPSGKAGPYQYLEYA